MLGCEHRHTILAHLKETRLLEGCWVVHRIDGKTRLRKWMQNQYLPGGEDGGGFPVNGHKETLAGDGKYFVS